MSVRAGRRPPESPTCPLLGLLDDPSSRFSFPTADHRCHASGRPRPIEAGHQGAFCLAATYPQCPRFQRAAASGAPGGAAPPTATVALEPVIAAVGAPGEPGRPSPGRSRWRRRAGILVLVAIVLAAAAWLGSPSIADWVRHLGAASGAASLMPSAPPPATPVPESSATPASQRNAHSHAPADANAHAHANPRSRRHARPGRDAAGPRGRPRRDPHVHRRAVRCHDRRHREGQQDHEPQPHHGRPAPGHPAAIAQREDIVPGSASMTRSARWAAVRSEPGQPR